MIRTSHLKRVPTRKARTRLGEILDADHATVITWHGRDRAVLIPIDLYDRYQEISGHEKAALQEGQESSGYQHQH